jgi:catechol 2,3-dioxygenase-like lactoylglutathione lyase family enzyme
MKPEKIDHINLKIPKNRVEDALSFYRDFLGMKPFRLEKYRRGERTSFFAKTGSGQMINLRPVSDFNEPEKENLDHFCILVDAESEEIRREAEEKGYKVVGTGNPLGSEGRNPAIYVEDPFGYKIELKEKK